jgi:Tfp pilus assembly protein PilF/SAM-dependent methyltransferase
MLRFGPKRAKPSVITLADRARDESKWELAAHYYRKALRRKPDNSPIWIQYGHVLKEAGHLAKSEQAYRTAVHYDRVSTDALVQLGHFLKAQGKEEEARAAYLRAIVLDPSLSRASLEFVETGWPHAYLAEIRIMLEASGIDRRAPPNFGSASPGRSANGSQSGRKDADKPSRGLLPGRLASARPSRITLADRARDAGKWQLAARYYRKALNRNPHNPPIWVQYGHALKESAELSAAEEAYRRAIELDSETADSYLQLGHALKLQGKRNEAAEAYLRAAALDPSLENAARELRDLRSSAPSGPTSRVTPSNPVDAALIGTVKTDIDAVYALVLGRLPEESIRAKQVTSPRPLIKVVDELVASKEFRNQVIDGFRWKGKLPHENLFDDDKEKIIAAARNLGLLNCALEGANSADWEIVLHAVFSSRAGYELAHRHNGAAAGHFVALLQRAADRTKLPKNFDPFLYLKANPDVVALGTDPIEHFLARGRLENRPLKPPISRLPDDFEPNKLLDTRPSKSLGPSFPLRDGTLPWPLHIFHYRYCDHEKLYRNRAVISHLYLKGSGIEVKALNAPFPLRCDSKVAYVESRTREQFRKNFPHLDGLAFVDPDILDDEASLRKLADASKDFAILSGVLPYLENPILAVENAARVVKPGGTICISVPDKRFGIDLRRQTTELEHFWRDYLDGPEGSRRSHYEEFAAAVLNGSEADPMLHPERLIYSRYPIHFHVWTHNSFIRFVEDVCDRLPLECDIELLCRNEIETICIMRK